MTSNAGILARNFPFDPKNTLDEVVWCLPRWRVFFALDYKKSLEISSLYSSASGYRVLLCYSNIYTLLLRPVDSPVNGFLTPVALNVKSYPSSRPSSSSLAGILPPCTAVLFSLVAFTPLTHQSVSRASTATLCYVCQTVVDSDL